MAYVDELKRLHAAATQGQMSVKTGSQSLGDTGDFVPYCLLQVGAETIAEFGERYSGESLPQDELDAAWIAAIHNAFPAILSERKALLAKLEAAQRLHLASTNLIEHLVDITKFEGDLPDEIFIPFSDAVAAFDKETA